MRRKLVLSGLGATQAVRALHVFEADGGLSRKAAMSLLTVLVLGGVPKKDHVQHILFCFYSVSDKRR